MKKRIAIWLPLLLPLLLLPLLTTHGLKAQDKGELSPIKKTDVSPDEAGILWRTDLAAARKDALKQGKPILYYYRCEP